MRDLWKQLHKGIVIAIVVAVVSVSVPISPTLEVRHAEAFIPTFGVDASGAANLVQNTLQAQSLAALELKEFTLDGIAYSLAKRAVSQMTSNIVQWINSGFQGSPMFVTDLGGFLTDIADQVAGDFIQQLGLGVLCSPFQLNVRAALEIQYQKSKTPGAQSQCTFSGVLDNLENFATGFSNWSDWFEITTRPQNNQYGALLIAQSELAVSIRNAQGQELELLSYGEGFLSMKQCDDNGQNCQVVTPGATIKETLDQHLGSGLASLIEADEIDEIINALFAQLAEQAVTGVNGLLGLSQGSGSGSSYLDRARRGDGGSVGFAYNRNDPIQKAITLENQVIGINRQIMSLIDDAESKLDADCSLSTPVALENAYDNALAEVTSAGLILNTLQELNARYNASDASGQSDVYLEYLELESSGYLYDQFDVIQFETQLEEIRTEVEEFEDDIDDRC